MQQFLTNEGINWKHILPKSPWWGAFYERLIRIIKEALKKSVKNAKLTYEELETILVEIEMVVNCRPLAYLYNDVEEEALTPSHLVIGRRLINPPAKIVDIDTEHSLSTLNARYKYLQTIIDHYWKRFSNEYLLELHQHHLDVNKGNYDELCRLLLGDVVLIKDDSCKRNYWQRGKVEQLITGSDGKVRGAILKVYRGGTISYIQRPLQKIIPLEVQHADIDKSSISDGDVKNDSIDQDRDSKSKNDIRPPKNKRTDVNICSDDISKRGRKRIPTDLYQTKW